MKKHWPRGMLLGISLALLLAGGVAVAQGYRVDAGCGTATIDGQVGAVEWANAAELPLFYYYMEAPAEGPPRIEGVGPSQAQVGTAYFMNDERYLYVGAVLPDAEDDVPDNPLYHDVFMGFAFEDEPAGDPAAWVDCAWEAPSCNEPQDEGQLSGDQYNHSNGSGSWVEFEHWAAPHQDCYDGTPAEGVTYDAAPRGSGADFEMRVDLQNSALNNPDPGAGDCFDLRWMFTYFWGQTAAGGFGTALGGWPSASVDRPDYSGECTVLCLNPCEAEFVPEPGTLMLLGSGLAGLAGYATLRWRTRE